MTVGNSAEPPEEIRVEDLGRITWIRPFHYTALGDIRMYQVRREDWSELVNRVHWNAYLKQKYSALTSKQRKMIADSLPDA